MPTCSRASLLGLGALSVLLAACGGEASTTGAAGTAVGVSAGEDSCTVERTELEAGPLTFAVTNDGSQTTEVYVYGDAGGAEYTEVIGEVENIGPGISRDLSVDLAAGSYEVACKPGQAGDGIRTPITVTGSGDDDPAAGGGSADGGYDREIELATDGTAITGMDGGAEAGETIEFTLTNDAGAVRVLELKDPAGTVVAEVEIAAGATGAAIVPLDARGTWQVIVEGDGVDDLMVELPVQ